MLQASYNGNTRPSQGRAAGSIPVACSNPLKNHVLIIFLILIVVIKVEIC